MGTINRCKYCGNFLKFLAYDDYGKAVYICTSSLTALSPTLEPTMVSCGHLYIEGKEIPRVSVDGQWISC